MGLAQSYTFIDMSASPLGGVIYFPAPFWELPLVLMVHTVKPFKLFIQCSLSRLSLKTAVLFPLTSAERVSDFDALFICPSCLLMREDVTDVTLKSCPLQTTMLKDCLAQGHFRQKHCLCPLYILDCYVYVNQMTVEMLTVHLLRRPWV